MKSMFIRNYIFISNSLNFYNDNLGLIQSMFISNNIIIKNILYVYDEKNNK